MDLSDLDEKEASLRRVRSVLASSSESVDDPAGLLRDVIQGANRGWNQTEARRTTFNELLGSGKFNFIRDAELRVKIAVANEIEFSRALQCHGMIAGSSFVFEGGVT